MSEGSKPSGKNVQINIEQPQVEPPPILYLLTDATLADRHKLHYNLVVKE